MHNSASKSSASAAIVINLNSEEASRLSLLHSEIGNSPADIAQKLLCMTLGLSFSKNDDTYRLIDICADVFSTASPGRRRAAPCRIETDLSSAQSNRLNELARMVGASPRGVTRAIIRNGLGLSFKRRSLQYRVIDASVALN